MLCKTLRCRRQCGSRTRIWALCRSRPGAIRLAAVSAARRFATRARCSNIQRRVEWDDVVAGPDRLVVSGKL